MKSRSWLVIACLLCVACCSTGDSRDELPGFRLVLRDSERFVLALNGGPRRSWILASNAAALLAVASIREPAVRAQTRVALESIREGEIPHTRGIVSRLIRRSDEIGSATSLEEEGEIAAIYACVASMEALLEEDDRASLDYATSCARYAASSLTAQRGERPPVPASPIYRHSPLPHPSHEAEALLIAEMQSVIVE